jgi:uncharacterized membrane protein YdbT with pleckstrin-like domain
VLKRIPFSFLSIFIIALIIFYSQFIPINYASLVNIILLILLVITILIIIFVFFIGWLEYLHYKISINEERIKISRGLISEEERGVPFRRIKEVTLKRSFFDQLFGVSKLVLEVSGGDDINTSTDETEIILPLLPKPIALQIQDNILKKAEVEKMDIREDDGK